MYVLEITRKLIIMKNVDNSVIGLTLQQFQQTRSIYYFYFVMNIPAIDMQGGYMSAVFLLITLMRNH